MATPTGGKKLKQACLPFKVLASKPVVDNVPNTDNAKKRKLSDESTGPVKAPKTPRSEEDTNKPIEPIDVDAENESKPNSESESKLADKPKATVKPVGLMDKFIKMGQAQLKTSSNDTKDESKEKEKQKQEVIEIASGNDENSNEEEDMEVENGENKEKSCENDDDSDEKDDVENKEDEESSTKDDSTGDIAGLKSPAPGKATKAKTPGSNRKPKSKEERDKLQKEREDKKQKEKEEKEKIRKEKETARQKEKEEKEAAKQREKEEKEKLKEEKRRERELEKEKKEKEKEEKKKQLEEEKKAKAEKKRLELEEEKKRKAEEKRLEQEAKEAERLKQEEEKKHVSQAQKALMKGFFTKQDKKKPEVKADEAEGTFMQFQPKPDTRLAPVIRVEKSEITERLERFDPLFESQDHSTLYIDELKNKKMKLKGTECKTWPYINEDSCCMIVDSNNETKPKKQRMRAKFLHFHANNRPAYYGTWRKQSKDVRPRNPLGQDTGILDYEVDSDEEWEEEEPGESLSGDEQEDDKEDEATDEEDGEDGFFVPHGYLSEGEGCEDDEDMTPERLKARQLAKAKAFEADLNKKTEALKPVIVGCYWQDQPFDLMTQMLEQFKMVMLTDSSTPISLESNEDDKSPVNKMRKKVKKTSKGTNLQQVPGEALPDLVRLVHGTKKGVPKLIREFREFWRLKEAGLDPASSSNPTSEASSPAVEMQNNDSKDSMDNKNDNMETDGDKETNPEGEKGENAEAKEEEKVYTISKRQLDKTIKEIAVWDCKRRFWIVNDATLEKYNLKDLPLPLPKEKKEKDGAATPTGRLTPSTEKSKKGGGGIKKFTVAGITPKPLPSPSTPKPHIVLSTPKGSVAMLFSSGKVPTPNTPIPKQLSETSDSASGSNKHLAPTALVNDDGNNSNGEEDDCAITNVELKPDKNQPGIMSMFKAAGKKVDGAAGTSSPAGKTKESLKAKEKTPKVTPAKGKAATGKLKKTPGSAKEKTPKVTPAKVKAATGKLKKAPGSAKAKTKSPLVTSVNGEKTASAKKPAKRISLNKIMKKVSDDAETLKKEKEERENVKGIGTAEAPMEID